MSTDFGYRTTRSAAAAAVTHGHVVVTAVVLSLSGVVALVSPRTWAVEATLTAVFREPWVGAVIATTAFLALCPFLLKCVGRAVDTQEAMSSDGLLPGAADSRRMPIVAALCVGGLATLTAAVLSVVNLLQLLALCTVTVHALVCLSLIVVQHKPADQLGIRLKNRYLAQPTAGDTWRPTETTVSYISVFSSDYGALQLRNDESPHEAAPDVTSPCQVWQTDAHMCQLATTEDSPSQSSASMSPTDRPPSSTSSSDTDIDEVVDEYQESQRIKRRRHFRDAFPSTSTYRYSVGATAVVCVCSVCLTLVVCRATHTDLRHPDALGLSLFGVLAVTLALAVVVVAAMPTNRLPVSSAAVSGTTRSRWTPLVCVSVQLVLVTSLPALVWVQCAGWLAVGE